MNEEKHVLLTSDRAFRVVPIEDLRTDPTYQRGVKAKHKRIVADFDKDAFGVPIIAQREDGTLWIVDGLQRITALKKLGHRTVRAEVFRSRGPEHEASVFQNINKNRVGLTASELFFAGLTAHDPTVWKVKEIAEGIGYVLRRGGGCSLSTDVEHAAKCLTCYGTLTQIALRTGDGYENVGDLLKTTLETLWKCWDTDPMRTKTDIVDGIACWLARYNGTADLDKLVSRLNTTQPRKILYSAGMGVGNRATNVADLIEKQFRKRTKKKA